MSSLHGSDGTEKRPNSFGPMSQNLTVNTKEAKLIATKDDTFMDLVNALEAECPDSTEEERVRFLKARNEVYSDALDQLKLYLEWRKDNKLDLVDAATSNEYEEDDWFSCTSSWISDDEWDWNEAVESAFALHQNVLSFPLSTTMPRLARLVINEDTGETMLDKDKKRILQLLPAQINPGKVPFEVYITAISIYLDKKLCRHSLEKVTVCVDVRAGRGWTNPPGGSIVPFIKGMINVWERNFPERLNRSIVYPLPMVGTTLARKVIKLFLEPDTANKIVVIRDEENGDSILVPKRFEEHIAVQTLEVMEKNRVSSFC